jgi:hypothetical protein
MHDSTTLSLKGLPGVSRVLELMIDYLPAVISGVSWCTHSGCSCFCMSSGAWWWLRTSAAIFYPVIFESWSHPSENISVFTRATTNLAIEEKALDGQAWDRVATSTTVDAAIDETVLKVKKALSSRNPSEPNHRFRGAHGWSDWACSSPCRPVWRNWSDLALRGVNSNEDRALNWRLSKREPCQANEPDQIWVAMYELSKRSTAYRLPIDFYFGHKIVSTDTTCWGGGRGRFGWAPLSWLSHQRTWMPAAWNGFVNAAFGLWFSPFSDVSVCGLLQQLGVTNCWDLSSLDEVWAKLHNDKQSQAIRSGHPWFSKLWGFGALHQLEGDPQDHMPQTSAHGYSFCPKPHLEESSLWRVLLWNCRMTAPGSCLSHDSRLSVLQTNPSW